jgi:tripartite-type tricarboxylate transporter receptor subunit TctC
MKLPRRRFLHLTAGAAALSVVSQALAQEWPLRPIRIVVPFAAGGPTDIVARVMGARMGELLGQQFVVENRAGAGGNLGAVAKSPSDGYTLLMATVSTHAINPGLYKKGLRGFWLQILGHFHNSGRLVVRTLSCR